MKALNVLSKVFFVISVSFISALCVFDIGIASLAQLAILAVLLGIFLRYTKGDVTQRIGNALYIFGCLFVIVTIFISEYIAFGCILAIVGVGFAGFGYFVDFLIYVKSSKTAKVLNPNMDPKVVALKTWKQYCEEGFVTKEEYEEKRKEILNINE